MDNIVFSGTKKICIKYTREKRYKVYWPLPHLWEVDDQSEHQESINEIEGTKRVEKSQIKHWKNFAKHV